MNDHLIFKNFNKHISLSDSEKQLILSLLNQKKIARKEVLFTEIQYPTAHRLLTKCDAILRIEGASKGADQDVEIGKKLALKIFYNLKDIPNAET